MEAFLPDIRTLPSAASLNTARNEMSAKQRSQLVTTQVQGILKDSNVGNLLVVAMAGMIAETLRYGDTRGGVADFTVATQILQFYQVPTTERDDYLRWAVLKALTLLNAHRDELDAVSQSMQQTQTIAQCMAAIEVSDGRYTGSADQKLKLEQELIRGLG